MAEDEHRIGLEDLYGRLGSSAAGLTEEEAARRLQLYGPNYFEERERTPLVLRFARHLVNFFALLLWTGAALAFMAESFSPGEGNLFIGAALVAVVLLNAAFTFVQEYESEKTMESFRRMMPARVEALRDGARREMLAARLVPGDVIFLGEGQKVPADGRLIEESSLRVDNSSLTGESEPQLRKLECTHENILESRNMVFSGTLVQSGSGAALVVATGARTQLGRIAQLTRRTVAAPSPLRRQLDHFIRVISTIAIVLGLVFFAVSVLVGNRLMTSLIFAIGIIVANVPEGLLPTVTLCLSMASRRMAGNMALLKRLESVETLGSTTVICTDKTGTITENRISANTLVLGMRERGAYEEGLGDAPGAQMAVRICVLCNNSRLDADGRVHGDPTEGALLLWARGRDDVARMRDENVRIHELPFDSRTKRMVTVNRSGGLETAYMKGAPEVVAERCDRLLLGGEPAPMGPAQRREIMALYERLASRGERVLALAYREGGEVSGGKFVFVGLVGMMDPPRKEVAGAVSRCRTAGIKVIMITGDYSLTAEAIAQRAGLTGPGGASVMTGEELDGTGEEGLREFLGKDGIIFARSSPVHKLRIVRALQSMGEVVTVTGDGVNDAPALKNADMGVAMGVSGTEVAREASDMVLMDDNFATIVKAVEEGRTVYSNIKKFIGYVLTSNIPEIMPFIAFVLLGIPLPLTVVLILSIDLGTDLLPALGLGIETPEEDVMSLPPRPRTERLLSREMLFRSYGVVGMVEAAAGFFSFFVVLSGGGWRWGEALAPTDPLYLRAVSAFFSSIIVCQVANVLASRTGRESVFKKGLFSNRLVLLGIASEFLLLGVIIYSPVTRELFRTYPLRPYELALSLPFAALILAGEEVRKSLIRRRGAPARRYLAC